MYVCVRACACVRAQPHLLRGARVRSLTLKRMLCVLCVRDPSFSSAVWAALNKSFPCDRSPPAPHLVATHSHLVAAPGGHPLATGASTWWQPTWWQAWMRMLYVSIFAGMGLCTSRPATSHS